MVISVGNFSTFMANLPSSTTTFKTYPTQSLNVNSLAVFEYLVLL